MVSKRSPNGLNSTCFYGDLQLLFLDLIYIRMPLNATPVFLLILFYHSYYSNLATVSGAARLGVGP